MTVILDDHLLRDWMVGSDNVLAAAISGEPIATTNLWYARLCKSAARATGGALLGEWGDDQRRALVAGLVALPEAVAILPMRQLAWKMAELAADHAGLSTLGAEAVAAAIGLDARLLVSSRDDGPGVRQSCRELAVPYDTLQR